MLNPSTGLRTSCVKHLGDIHCGRAARLNGQHSAAAYPIANVGYATCHFTDASMLSQAQQKINAARNTSPKNEYPGESCVELVVGMVDQEHVK